MIGVIITGHGQFATGLLSSIELIAGSFDNVTAVDFNVNHSTEDLICNLKQAVNKLVNCDKVIFLADLAGGSPFRCSVLVGQEIAESKIIAGVNSPMALEVIFNRESSDMENLKDIAVEVGKNGIKAFGDEPKIRKNLSGVGI